MKVCNTESAEILAVEKARNSSKDSRFAAVYAAKANCDKADVGDSGLPQAFLDLLQKTVIQNIGAMLEKQRQKCKEYNS